MPSPRPSGWQEYARYSGLGLQLFVAIGLLAWIGWWLDGRLGWSPFGLVVGVFLGFAAGLFSILSKVPGGVPRAARRPPPPSGTDPPATP